MYPERVQSLVLLSCCVASSTDPQQAKANRSGDRLKAVFAYDVAYWALPNGRIAAIRAPTLIFHATDDTLQLYRNAEFAAATIPGARLHRFERGGHLLIAVEQPRIRAEIQAFLRSNAANSSGMKDPEARPP